MLKYCTNCDQDAFSGLCGKCGTTNHIIERDADEKCAACGEEWNQHGDGKSASACNIAPGGHFVPPAAGISYIPSSTTFGKMVDYLRSQAAASLTSGMKCAKCGDFNDFAVSNQADGTFKCYVCRQH